MAEIIILEEYRAYARVVHTRVVTRICAMFIARKALHKMLLVTEIVV